MLLTEQLSPCGFVTSIENELSYRMSQYNPGHDLVVTTSVKDHIFRISFRVKVVSTFDIDIPLPWEDKNGNTIIGSNVKRCPGTWIIDNREYEYLSLMNMVLCNDMNRFFGLKINSTPLARLAQLHRIANPYVVVRNISNMISSVVNSIPLSEHPLKDYVMNRRITIFDPSFDELKPEEKLEYQVAKQILYFPFTSLGLSDSAASDTNTLLKCDIRTMTPFSGHHNPLRNLYSTLGMKGSERALIQTQSEKSISAKRTGYNWVTAFVDLPNNFEDQLIISNRLMENFAVDERRFNVFGKVCVLPGEKIQFDRILSIEPDGTFVKLDTHCDYAVVKEILDSTTNFSGKATKTNIIVIEMHRKFSDGYKFTNRHGNKGVCVFGNTGEYKDPETGRMVPIDIIVSAKSILKRRNFGQIIEALVNTLNKNEPCVVNDKQHVSIEKIRAKLTKRGYPKDLTCKIHISGTNNNVPMRAICGRVFWGLIKTTEDQIWTAEDLEAKRANGAHKAGLKVSPVEIKSLTTALGTDCKPVLNEILSYSAGTEQFLEYTKILESSLGKVDLGLPIIKVSDIAPVSQTQSSFKSSEEEFQNTVCDINRFAGAFLMEIPFYFYTLIDSRGKTSYSWYEPTEHTGQVFKTNLIYIPGRDERRPWKHISGYYGMGELAVFLNNVVDFCFREHDDSFAGKPFVAVKSLFEHIANRTGGKKGLLSQSITSVRFTRAAKAVAILDCSLPSNTVSIHKDMAKELDVKDGDIVITERFPCLGFPSMRLQKIHIHNDEKRRHTIAVSGNSLVSQGLDFDGDVLYILVFVSPRAKAALKKHFETPVPKIAEAISRINNRIKPFYNEMGIDDYNICKFSKATAEENAECIRRLAGVKLNTGPIVALCYNLMRIAESTIPIGNPLHIVIELMLDRVANTVFAQKHGVISLKDEAIKNICLADINGLKGLFKDTVLEEKITEEDIKSICDMIRREAASIGVYDLQTHYDAHINAGKSNIINQIVRTKHPVYFASRSKLSPYVFLKKFNEETGDADLVSAMVAKRLSVLRKARNG